MPKEFKVSEEMWKTIEAEYISSDISLRGLEKKYGIPFSQIQKNAKNGKWKEVKDEVKSKSIQKSVDLISTHKAEECTKAFCIANKVLDKLGEIVENINPKDAEAEKRLKSITSSIKDLKEIGVFRSALDQEEQEARIKKLQKDAEEEGKDTNITVIIDDEVKRFCR